MFARYVHKAPAPAIRFALGMAGRWPVSDEKIGFEYKLKRFLEGSLMTAEQAHVYWNGTFSSAQKKRLVRTDFSGAFDQMLGELAELLPGANGVLPYLWFDQKYYLPDDILVKSDRMSMAHAVEVRPPFLDHRIIEFAATIPPELKIRGSRQKVVLKELMKGKLPDSVLRRKKVGFDIPAHEWLRGPLRPLLLDSLQVASEYSDIFRNDVIQTALSRHLERKENLGYHLWGLMVLFLWMKRWRIQAPRVSALAPEHASAQTGVSM
jgi:asparagine synthase (glutamine-hydrolysing)